MEESSTPTQPRMPRQATRNSHSHSPQHHPIAHQAGESTRSPARPCLSGPLTWHTGTPEQAPHAAPGLVHAHTNNLLAYTTQPPSTYAQEFGLAAASGYSDFSFTNNAYGSTAAVDAAAWNNPGIPVSVAAQPQPHSQFQTRPVGQAATLPPRSRHTPAPTIITTDLSQFPQQLPQDYHNYSATSVSPSSTVPLQEATSYHNFPHPQFDNSHLSPHSPYMAETFPPEAQEMQTTTPPRSPNELHMGEQMSRKRSHSQISNGPPFLPVEGSNHGSQMGDEEFDTGRLQISRPDPLMNQARKYLCNFQEEECAHLTFDRKCEWRYVIILVLHMTLRLTLDTANTWTNTIGRTAVRIQDAPSFKASPTRAAYYDTNAKSMASTAARKLNSCARILIASDTTEKVSRAKRISTNMFGECIRTASSLPKSSRTS